MKKFYSLSCALLLMLAVVAQNQQKPGAKTVIGVKDSYIKETNVNRVIKNPDTTGLANYVDFLPEFYPSGSGGIYYYEWDYNMPYGGYYFGNNRNGWNVWAQGYYNVNPTPVKVIGAIVWFRKKQSDLTTNSNSVVTIGAYAMAANKAYNTDGSGTYNLNTANWTGPATITPVVSATKAFSVLDTTIAARTNGKNYVAFSPAPTFTGDFAISIDTRTLVAGDTVGILADDFTTNDAQNLDYNYVLSYGSGGKWIAIDYWGSNDASPDFGSGGFDLNLAIFAVVSDATGVNEFFNGMKLTTYPNPSVEKATIEYTLEKNSNHVSLVLYDQEGGKVIDKEYTSQSAGTYKVDFETSNLAAGTYFYQLRANGHDFTKQLIVTK
jgi:hypothetical protein